MGTAAEQMFDEFMERREAEEAAERAAWLETPEGQKATLEWERAGNKRERARLEDERADVGQEKVWARDHPEAWAAWQAIQPFWEAPLEFVFAGREYGFQEFLAEVGTPPPKPARVGRKDDRLPFRPGNLKWAETQTNQVESPYFDYRRAAAYLGEKVKTLQNAKVAGKLQPVQGGAGVSFLREELDRYKQDGDSKRR